MAITSGLLLQLAWTDHALAQEQPPEPARPASRVEFGAELEVAYTSNPYHEQNRRLDDFDRKSDPGERYEDMEGPADLYARPAIGVEWARRTGARRRLRLSAGAELTAYARNTLANYVSLEAGASLDLTKRDRAGLEVDLVPRRFKKNYYNDVGGNKVYDRAYYLEVAPELSYRRDWTKRWATELAYEVTLRRYDDPFAHRDSTTHGFVLLVLHELSQRVTLSAGPEIAFAQVDPHTEFGARVDRSHRDLGALAGLELNLAHGWAAALEIELERKRYLSDDPADDAHHDRTDLVVDVQTSLEKRLDHTWSLAASLGYERSTSDRINATVDADEYGYAELVVGVGGQARF